LAIVPVRFDRCQAQIRAYTGHEEPFCPDGLSASTRLYDICTAMFLIRGPSLYFVVHQESLSDALCFCRPRHSNTRVDLHAARAFILLPCLASSGSGKALRTFLATSPTRSGGAGLAQSRVLTPMASATCMGPMLYFCISVNQRFEIAIVGLPGTMTHAQDVPFIDPCYSRAYSIPVVAVKNCTPSLAWPQDRLNINVVGGCR
jgi:hypothetical protein